MVCSALLAWWSPPRERRWRIVCPEEAGLGAVPLQRANAASLLRRLGSQARSLAAESIRQCRAATLASSATPAEWPQVSQQRLHRGRTADPLRQHLRHLACGGEVGTLLARHPRQPADDLDRAQPSPLSGGGSARMSPVRTSRPDPYMKGLK
jgi:hypothetical protein